MQCWLPIKKQEDGAHRLAHQQQQQQQHPLKRRAFFYEKEITYEVDNGLHNDHDDDNDWSDHDGPHPGSGAPVLLGSRPHSQRAGEHQDKTTFEQDDDIEQQRHCAHAKNDSKGWS